MGYDNDNAGNFHPDSLAKATLFVDFPVALSLIGVHGSERGILKFEFLLAFMSYVYYVKRLSHSLLKKIPSSIWYSPWISLLSCGNCYSLLPITFM